MAALIDSAMAFLRTADDAARLTAQLLPDVDARQPGFFFRPTEQHLLGYVLTSAVLREEKDVSHVRAFLALEYQPMTDRFKAVNAPELQEHAAYLAVLSDPRLSHARWGVSRVIFAGP